MIGRTQWLPLVVVLSAVPLTSCGQARRPALPTRMASTVTVPVTIPEKIVTGARQQIGDRYVADYQVIPYPNGDVPAGQGACTDVVIRSLRCAGIDLQKAVHEDMQRHFAAYPHKWGLNHPDTSIDHRRVPNLQTYFRRSGAVVNTADWLPGDIVTWKLGSSKDHCGIISDRRNRFGTPFVIHNMGQCAEEDCLNAWKITGHFRIK